MEWVKRIRVWRHCTSVYFTNGMEICSCNSGGIEAQSFNVPNLRIKNVV